MRRVLLLLLLLLAPALAEEEPDALSQLQDLYRYASIISQPYGHHAANLRVIGAQQAFYQALKPIAGNQQEAIERVLASLHALRLQALTFSGQHQAALDLGPDPGQTGDAQLIAWMALVRAARQSAQPAVVKRYLPPLLKALEQAQGKDYLMYQFAARTYALEPDKLSDAQLKQAHDRIWKPVKGQQLVGFGGDSQHFLEAARLWLELYTARGLPITPDIQVLEDLPLNSVAVDAVGQLNICHDLALLNIALDQAETESSRERTESIARTFEQRLPLYRKADQAVSAKLKAESERLVPLLAPYKMITYDPTAVQFSLLDGDVSRSQARIHQLQARFAASYEEAQRHLDRAEEAQKRARVGQGFLGMNDVAWDQLRLLCQARPPGWEARADALLKPFEASSFRPAQLEARRFRAELLARPQAIALLTETIAELERDLPRERYRDTYALLARLQLEEGQNEAAYATLGRQQQLTGAAAAAPSEKLELLRGQADSLEEQVAVSRALGQDTKPTEQLLAKTKGEFFATLNDLRRQNPNYESLLAVRPVNYSKQQAFIPAEAALVQYLPADDALYIFVVTRSDLKIHKVNVPAAELGRLIVEFRRNALPPAQANLPALQAVLKKLYAALVAPVEQDVASARVLAFIPTGVLCYVPFSALADERGYLAQRKQCVTLLKSSDVEQLGRPATPGKGALLAVGNPDGSLPGAAQEASEVAALFKARPLLGDEATSPQVTSGLKGAAYVHLATHGRLNSKNPAESYLVLAGGQRLDVTGIYDLNLQKVRLVTLSACQTALAQADPGSEIQSLADAFGVAGANSVVASLWSVSDESTRQLMVEFYRQLQKGASLAAALNAAELSVLKTKPHPFHWAPFVLIGDWR